MDDFGNPVLLSTGLIYVVCCQTDWDYCPCGSTVFLSSCNDDLLIFNDFS